MSKENYPKKIGKGLAKVQSWVDNALTAGFQALKKAGKKKRVIDDETVKGKVVKGLSKTAGFVGETGESFFSEYEKIKAQKAKKKK